MVSWPEWWIFDFIETTCWCSG